MATNTDSSAGYEMVARRHTSKTGLESEPFETLRDLLGLESRLRVTPPGRWSPERQAATERSWTGYGHTVRLRTPSVLGEWTVSVDGEVVCADVDRRVAFEAAAERMREIAARAPAEE